MNYKFKCPICKVETTSNKKFKHKAEIKEYEETLGFWPFFKNIRKKRETYTFVYCPNCETWSFASYRDEEVKS